MIATARLSRSFDRERLLADLDALRAFPETHFEERHRSGRWGGVSLYAQGGRFDVLTCGDAPYEPTEALARCAYYRELLDSLDAPKLAVRVLSLAPGARIVEHYDPASSVDLGTARLHVPIVTHRDVDFRLAGRRLDWKPGELWYGDFTFPHRAHNRSSIARVHLVIDVVVTDAIRALFPRDFLGATHTRSTHRQLRQWIYDQKIALEERLSRLVA